MTVYVKNMIDILKLCDKLDAHIKRCFKTKCYTQETLKSLQSMLKKNTIFIFI